VNAPAPPDQAERDAIRNDLDVTMLVEAAAGTGKTTNLVKRMVNLVATEKATPATIAAITFTLKAAAHLREQFQQALRNSRASEETGAPLPGFIGTTHAFCARLLRERPVEAGLDPEFEELDEAAARQITSDFWNRWYDAKSVSEDPLVAEAREAGLDRKTLRSAFVRIVEHPDVVLVSERRPRPDLRAAINALFAFLEECEPHLPTDGDRDAPDDFEIMVRKLMNLRTSSDLGDTFDQIVLLDEANHASRKPVQKRWPDGPTAKQLGLAYKDLVDNTIRPALREWREHVHGIALELLRPAALEFAAERRRNGTLTFQDLLVCARDLLRDHPNVRRYFQHRFTHVLVDEFQDTDPVQAEVLMYLTGLEVEERNWRKIHPRPGSLFIVGDPKQSIYRFRRADITTYLEVKKRIEMSGGHIVPLWTNFRSVAAICTYVNEAFSTLFSSADVEAGMQASHVDLESFVAEKSGGVFSLESVHGRNEDMACTEAETVGNWIRRSVAAGSFKWTDVLLVSWQRPRLSCYARTFERLGIPYEITGSKAFSGLSALEWAMPLLRAVVTPEDEVAIVAFLRGPLCGVDDDALYRYRTAGGRFSPFAQTDFDPRITFGLRAIREAIEDARLHPPAAAIARLLDRIGLLALSSSADQPGTRSGNLLLAVSIARDLSARGETLASIVERLGDLLEDPPDIEELDVDPTRTDAVRLMNLHQVKGLEAPVVFLIDPADEHDFDIELFVDRTGEESRGHFAVTREFGRGRKDIGLPVGWEAHKRTEKAFKQAEKMRLLYVAATRAKEMLVVGFRTSSGKVKGAWRELASRITQRLIQAEHSGAPPTPAAIPVKRAIEEIETKFAVARTPSYSVLPITKIAHANHLELVKAEEGLGKGTSWGRVLHRLFEAMLRDESLDIRLYAENLLKDEERDPVELPEVLRVVEAVRGSTLWSRVKAADERYVEIPFALTVSRREVGLEEDGETLLHGTIDLVFREGDRWFIVDYKSDSTKGRLPFLIEYYKPQVEHYARFWSQLTNAPATGGLFFVDGSIEHWV
jgi:ATP-dependent helicase/nuclease subunit A